MQDERKAATSQMSSVLRTFEILEAVAEKQPVSLRELVKHFSYSKSTLQRSLTTLQGAGWLRQVASDNPSWEVTARSLLVKPRVLEGSHLYARASGPMIELRDKTNETIHLSILDNLSNAVLIDRVDCDQAVRTFSPVGDYSPIHATSIGRAIMAYLPAPAVEKILSNPLQAYTEKTLYTREAILADLEVIRERGYSVNIGEYRSSVCAIGAPVLNEDGIAIAGICISTPKLRFDESNIELWGGWVRDAARQISDPGSLDRLNVRSGDSGHGSASGLE